MIVAIIQARMGSTRLPGKVLMDLNGEPMLKMLLRRVALAEKVQKVVVATSSLNSDDKIAEFCAKEGVEVFRGSEDDVLSRYYECATKAGATVIVRLTGDCPLIDPGIIDRVVKLFEDTAVDYAANTVPPETRTFPSGSDVEVFTYSALARAHEEATDPGDREHVTFCFWKKRLSGIRTTQFRTAEDWSKYRLSVDYPEDLEVIRAVVTGLPSANPVPPLAEIIKFLEDRPDLYALNSKYYFGQGWKNK